MKDEGTGYLGDWIEKVLFLVMEWPLGWKEQYRKGYFYMQEVFKKPLTQINVTSFITMYL